MFASSLWVLLGQLWLLKAQLASCSLGTTCPLNSTRRCHISVYQSVSSKPTSEIHCAPRPRPLRPLDRHSLGRLWSWFSQANFRVVSTSDVKFRLCVSFWSKPSLLEPLLVSTRMSFGQARTKTVQVFLSLPL